jgi:hypothetical protein
MRKEEGRNPSYQDFFSVVAPEMNADVAYDLLEALGKEDLIVGLYVSKTPEGRRKAARAREIIASFGLTCPVTFENPSRRRRL